jgi:hypothetical protein
MLFVAFTIFYSAGVVTHDRRVGSVSLIFHNRRSNQTFYDRRRLCKHAFMFLDSSYLLHTYIYSVRVARFFLVQHTKKGKIYQNDYKICQIKCNKCP